MHKSIAVFLLAAIAAPASHLMAAIIPPIGLAPGQQYQLIFVTADTTHATSGDITDYNYFVSAEAALNPSLPSGVTWHAVGSTGAKSGNPVDANTNAPSGIDGPAVPVYNTNGVEVATAAGLYDTLPLLNPIEYDQFGNPVLPTAGNVNQLVWTGSDPSGFGVGGNELGAPLSNGTAVGILNATSSEWAREQNGGTVIGDSLSLPLYALSTAITVPSPEPPSLALAVIALAGLLARRWWSR